jgi:hypothetical protein
MLDQILSDGCSTDSGRTVRNGSAGYLAQNGLRLIDTDYTTNMYSVRSRGTCCGTLPASPLHQPPLPQICVSVTFKYHGGVGMAHRVVTVAQWAALTMVDNPKDVLEQPQNTRVIRRHTLGS